MVSVEREKNANGFWEWTSVSRQDGPLKVNAESSNKATPTKPTYETPDERAHKQVIIVRQSSISSAVNTIGPMKLGINSDDHVEFVIKTAKRFESYVLGQTVHDMINDIPN